jgi:hypothetical protein
VRLLWTALRVLLVLGAIFTITLTPFWISSPSGTTIDPGGAIIVAVALVVLVASAWSLWRDRARLT